MRKVLLFPLLIWLLASCQNQKREQRLQKKEAELAHREQASQKARQAADSAHGLPLADAALVRSLAGTWVTRTGCIETDCPGSAISDRKNEQWKFTNEQGSVLVKALANNKIVRVYTGTLQGSELQLTARHLAGEALPDATIRAQLQLTAGKRLEGRREIKRPDNCRIVYVLTPTRAPQPLLPR